MKYKKSYWNWKWSLSKTSNTKEKLRKTLWFDYFNKRVVDIILSLPKNAEVADCWCWLWINLLRVKQIRPDIKITWFDIGEFKPSWMDNFFNYDLMSLMEHKELKDKYDLVICMHVIEHIKDVFWFMDNLNYITKVYGYLYVECPSHRTIFLPWNFNFYVDPTHIRPYDKYSLRKLWIYENNDVLYSWYSYPTFFWRIIWFILVIPTLIINYELWKFLLRRLFWFYAILITRK